MSPTRCATDVAVPLSCCLSRLRSAVRGICRRPSLRSVLSPPILTTHWPLDVFGELPRDMALPAARVLQRLRSTGCHRLRSTTRPPSRERACPAHESRSVPVCIPLPQIPAHDSVQPTGPRATSPRPGHRRLRRVACRLHQPRSTAAGASPSGATAVSLSGGTHPLLHISMDISIVHVLPTRTSSRLPRSSAGTYRSAGTADPDHDPDPGSGRSRGYSPWRGRCS